MTLPIMPFVPEKSGYTATFAPGSLRAAFGALGKYKSVPKQASIVNVQWQLTAAEFDRFMIFHNTTIIAGGSPFQIDLILDTPYPETYTAFLVPKSLSINSVSGNTFSVSASLRVQ